MAEDKNNPPKKNFYDTGFALLVFLFALLIAFKDKYLSKKQQKELQKGFTESKLIHKGKLIEDYGVDYKTFMKWIYYFAPSLWTVEEYRKKKKLTLEEYVALGNLLGLPSKEYPVLSKKQIAETCNSDTQTLKECIELNPSLYGITIEAYQKLYKFPPRVTKDIIEAFN